MQKKVALFLNGIRGKQIELYLKKKKIKIDNIFYQKKLFTNKKFDFSLVQKKINKKNNYVFLFVGFNKIIKKDVLNYPKFGCYNCHAGYLPKYRGASPIVYQLLNHESKGACYILKMTDGIDEGPYLLKQNYKIFNNDNATSITNKTGKIFCNLTIKFLKIHQKNKKIKLIKQPKNPLFYWTKRFPHDGLINWASSSRDDILSLVRALTKPYPGAFSFINKKKITIEEAISGPDNIKGVPGRVVRLSNENFTVLCKKGSIIIKKIRNYKIKNLLKSKIIKYGVDLK